MKRMISLLSLSLTFVSYSASSLADSAPPLRSGFVAEFNPAEGKLPFPSNLLFTGSSDGTLNIPVADPGNLADPQVALNALDGFSTVAPITAHFTSSLNPATIAAGTTVRLFEVTVVNPFLNPTAGALFTVESVQRELTPDEDYAAALSSSDPTQTTLIIVPLRPLKPKTDYLVILTDGIRGVDGFAPLPDLTYILARGPRTLVDGSGASLFASLNDTQARTLEPIRRMVVSQEDAAAGQGIARGSIVLSWTFTTESTSDVLAAVRDDVAPQTVYLAATGLNTGALGLGLPGIANIYAGTLTSPYYLDRTTPLSGHWQRDNGGEPTRYRPTPTATEIITIPVLVTVPNAASGHERPQSGWSCIIFQHGITQNRTNLLAIADTLAAIGSVGVAIDLPLHGITDNSSPFYDALHERTFNLDLVNNATLQPPADGSIDPSGSHFINLASLLTSRDNLRQGVADLLSLAATIPILDIEGDAVPDCDTKRTGFIGHSLGGIVGGTFLGLDDGIAAATLAMPGGGIAKLLDGSATFGPPLAAGLAANGLLKGTAEYEIFLAVAQTVLDAADPINYAAAAAAHPIHMLEVIGGAGSLSDQVVPNGVSDAPLSGTEPLALIMNLQSITTTGTDTAGIRSIVRFTAGAHSSLIDPIPSPAVTVEMQSELASFIATSGTTLTVSNPDVVSQLK